MRLIDADALMDALGIAVECSDCANQAGAFCHKSSDFVNACEAICDAPTADAIPIEYMRSQIDCGKWEELIRRWREHDKA